MNPISTRYAIKWTAPSWGTGYVVNHDTYDVYLIDFPATAQLIADQYNQQQAASTTGARFTFTAVPYQEVR